MRPTEDGIETAPVQANLEVQAAKAFLRQQSEGWIALDQADLDAWRADPACDEAYRKISRTWRRLGHHATSPEVIALREQALGSARRPDAQRWLDRSLAARWKLATAAAVLVVIGLAPAVFVDKNVEAAYRTGSGEQRVVELEDGSSIALDAQTVLHVRLTRDSRVVELAQGQAQFIVASDPRRPFRVEAGEHTITAVGTSFNVEYQDRLMQVAMVEGKVAVSVGAPSAAVGGTGGQATPAPVQRSIDLIAGQELRVEPDGRTELLPLADIAAAIAWRQGIMILKDTPLGDAVRELNRHSRLQIRISDPAVGAMLVSGVFETGNTPAFIQSVQSLLPVTARQDSPQLVQLSPARNPD